MHLVEVDLFSLEVSPSHLLVSGPVARNESDLPYVVDGNLFPDEHSFISVIYHFLVLWIYCTCPLQQLLFNIQHVTATQSLTHFYGILVSKYHVSNISDCYSLRSHLQ